MPSSSSNTILSPPRLSGPLQGDHPVHHEAQTLNEESSPVILEKQGEQFKRRFGPAERRAAQRLWQAPPLKSVDSSLLYKPERGGVMVKTSIGWIQLGVPMWAGKDQLKLYFAQGGSSLAPDQVPQVMATFFVHDPDFNPEDGFLPFDFLQYLYFMNGGLASTFATTQAQSAKQLRAFLDLSYQGDSHPALDALVVSSYPPKSKGIPQLSAEISHGFPSPPTQALRQVLSFDDQGQLTQGPVTLVRLGNQEYEIIDQGESLGKVSLKGSINAPPSVERSLPPQTQAALQDVLVKGELALWPVGTSHGFDPQGETAGFMIWNQGKVFLVDPPTRTLDDFHYLNIPLDTISGILITHGHTDHAGNGLLRLLKEHPQIPLYSFERIFVMVLTQHVHAFGGLGALDWKEFLKTYAAEPDHDPKKLALWQQEGEQSLSPEHVLACLYLEAQQPTRTKLKAALDQALAPRKDLPLFKTPLHFLKPQTPTLLHGLTWELDYSFHSIPTLAFQLFDPAPDKNPSLIAWYSGDTLAHPDILKRVDTGLVSYERALRILQHYFLIPLSLGASPSEVVALLEKDSSPLQLPFNHRTHTLDFVTTLADKLAPQNPPPVFLIEDGYPDSLHIDPKFSKRYLDFLIAEGFDKQALKERVRLYHLSDAKASQEGLEEYKWKAESEGFINLQAHVAQKPESGFHPAPLARRLTDVHRYRPKPLAALPASASALLKKRGASLLLRAKLIP